MCLIHTPSWRLPRKRTSRSLPSASSRISTKIGCCRMCVVEVKGSKALQAACVHPVKEGMEVLTHTTRVRKARKTTLELILSNHNANCQTCTRSWMDCELQSLANKLSVKDVRFKGESEKMPLDIGPFPSSVTLTNVSSAEDASAPARRSRQ